MPRLNCPRTAPAFDDLPQDGETTWWVNEPTTIQISHHLALVLLEAGVTVPAATTKSRAERFLHWAGQRRAS